MDVLEALAIAAAGMAAGAINTIVGSGSLITFPVLIALGYAPLVANVSNNIGLVPGGISGIFGYRRELAGQRHRIIGLGVFSVVGAAIGATLLLTLPASAFDAIVPALIAIALILVVVQPRLTGWLAKRGRTSAEHGPALQAAVGATGIYGGYFGAAQGVILIALLSILVDDSLQRLNGLKNLMTAAINGVAAIIFIAVAPVAWGPAILLAIGSTIGGQLGALVGRRLSPIALRGAIIVVGTIVAVRLLLG
jgi:uncharacterized membrane protein YfcA